MEKGEIEENICGECGTELPDLPLVRIESAGKNSSGVEIVNVTFAAARRRIDVYRGIVEYSEEFLDMDEFIHRALDDQCKRYFDFLHKTDRLWGLLARVGVRTDPEAHGIEFAS